MIKRLAFLVLASCVTLRPAVALAQGFGVYEQGACMMSRASSGVAEPCREGGAIYINPAGLAGQRGVVISGGIVPVMPTGNFTSDDGRRTEIVKTTEVVPHGYFTYGMSEKLALGVGIYTPYGLGVQWPLDFDGRFVSYDSSLKTLYIQPTVSYAVNDRVAIGGGLTIASGNVQLKRRENLAAVTLPNGVPLNLLVNDYTDFEDTTLKSSWASGVGFNVGVILKANERLRFGVRYLSKVTLDYDGRTEFVPLPGPYPVTKPNPFGIPVGTPLDSTVALIQSTLPDQPTATSIDMPAQFVVGVSAHATARLSVFTDYSWTGWSTFKALTLDFSAPSPADQIIIQNDRDTGALRLGADYTLSPKVRLSGGYIYNNSAAPDENVTPLLPEATRQHLTTGVGWNVGAKFGVDVAYQSLFQSDRRGRIVSAPSGVAPTVALNSGVYRSRIDLLGVTLTYRP